MVHRVEFAGFALNYFSYHFSPVQQPMVSFEQATTDFVEWLQRENVNLLPKVAVQDLRTHHQGRGLVAVEDIGQGEELFKIPRNIIINAGNCLLVRDRPDLQDRLNALNHWELLIIILFYELQLGEKSPWIHYFNTLPVNDQANYSFNQLMFWSDEELELLKPSLILDRVGREVAEAMFNRLFPAVIVHDFGIDLLKDITLDQYHRIGSLIMSHSFDVETPQQGQDGFVSQGNGVVGSGGHDSDSEEPEVENVLTDGYYKSMVPLADVLNADSTYHNSSLMYTPEALVMTSVKPIKKGDQIFNTYSEHPNSEILRRYGYVEPLGSIHDFGEVPLGHIQRFFTKAEGANEDLATLVLSLLSPSFMADITEIVKEITLKELLDGEDLVEVILDSYDCFRNGGVIIEFIFLVQFLTILNLINFIKSLEFLSQPSKFRLVNRVFKKCYQLIESRKLTKIFLKNFEKIISMRIRDYPSFEGDTLGSAESINLDRSSMAKVVLRSEVELFQACLDFLKTFTIDGETYSFINDDKLIRNIVNKKFFVESPEAEDEVVSKVELVSKEEAGEKGEDAKKNGAKHNSTENGNKEPSNGEPAPKRSKTG